MFFIQKRRNFILFFLIITFAFFTFESLNAKVVKNESKLFNSLISKSNRYISIVDTSSSSNLINKNKSISFEKDGKYNIELSIEFDLDFELDNFVSLNINTPTHIQDFILNGKKVIKPLNDMRYKTIPGIPVSLLKPGKNILTASWIQKVISSKKAEEIKEKGRRVKSYILVAPSILSSDNVKIDLIAKKPIDLTFQTGPVLGYVGFNSFTATCRVNIPAEVILVANGVEYKSETDTNSLLHSFKVENLKENTEYKYFLKARVHDKKYETKTATYTVNTLENTNTFKFIMLGDSRSYPDVWKTVSEAALKENPAFSIFLGDMVGHGKRDYEWDEDFFSPAKTFLANIPFYAIIGNHEKNCSLFTKIFKTPSGEKNWTQEINSVLFIGLDGYARDKEKNKQTTIWLENILSKSKAKFIFLASHYPAWASDYHGNLGYKKGEDKTLPRETGPRFARITIMPLLKKYNVTAMFTGHSHCYERSEPENNLGVSQIITGGCGAPLYDKEENASMQNPFSIVYEQKYHYCLLTIQDDKCIMTVKTPDGSIIDKREWKAR